MSEHTEVMFTVKLVTRPNKWGTDMTARIENPDGSVVNDYTVSCGPDGFVGADESTISDFVGDEAKEFMETFFAAVAEQTRQYQEWR